MVLKLRRAQVSSQNSVCSLTHSIFSSSTPLLLLIFSILQLFTPLQFFLPRPLIVFAPLQFSISQRFFFLQQYALLPLSVFPLQSFFLLQVFLTLQYVLLDLIAPAQPFLPLLPSELVLSLSVPPLPANRCVISLLPLIFLLISAFLTLEHASLPLLFLQQFFLVPPVISSLPTSFLPLFTFLISPLIHFVLFLPILKLVSFMLQVLDFSALQFLIVFYVRCYSLKT